jgi:hypothetical protein
VDGLLLIVLNLKLDFLENAGYRDIQKTLTAIELRVNKYFNYRDAERRGKWYFRGTFNGPPAATLSRCALLFYPRFLVPRFPGPKDDMVEDYARDLEIYQKDASGVFDHARTSREYAGLVAGLEPRKHFDVAIRTADLLEGHGARWDPPQGRKLTLTTGWFTDANELLAQELPRMVGIEKRTDDLISADLVRLADGILADARIERF